MRDRKIGFAKQYIVVISVLLLLVNILLGSVLLTRSKTLMKTLIHERMLDVANTSADMLDGDSLEHIGADSAGTPEYQAIFDALRVFQDNINLEYIYTVRPMPDGTFMFLVDPIDVNPSEYGDFTTVTEALQTAARGIPAVDQEPYEDEWG